MTAPLEDFTAAQRDRLAAIEAASPAPESFDAVAALRRVLALADEWDTEARQWLDQAAVDDGQGFHETALAQRDNACEQLTRAARMRAAVNGADT